MSLSCLELRWTSTPATSRENLEAKCVSSRQGHREFRLMLRCFLGFTTTSITSITGASKLLPKRNLHQDASLARRP